MRSHLRYLRYVVRHKWFVLVAGLRVGGIPLWRLLIHDWSKFMPAEWGPYARFFYGKRAVAVYGDTRNLGGYSQVEIDRQEKALQAAFDAAWLHHQHASPHHWQHWILREDSGETKLIPMPEHFAREMVADWYGAGRAITGKWEAPQWYEKNRDKMQMHVATRTLVARLLRLPCHCGAINSKEACDHFGYCEAHLTPVEAQGGHSTEHAKLWRVGAA